MLCEYFSPQHYKTYLKEKKEGSCFVNTSHHNITKHERKEGRFKLTTTLQNISEREEGRFMFCEFSRI